MNLEKAERLQRRLAAAAAMKTELLDERVARQRALQLQRNLFERALKMSQGRRADVSHIVAQLDADAADLIGQLESVQHPAAQSAHEFIRLRDALGRTDVALAACEREIANLAGTVRSIREYMSTVGAAA